VRPLRFFFVTLVCLWVAGGCQLTVGPRIAIVGAVPDFLMISAACLGLFATPRGGALAGFLAGVLHGALAGANLGSYAVSRAVAGFLAGTMNTFEFESSPVVAFFVTGVTTIVAQLLLMFVAPPPSLISFLLATIGSAVYNGVLAMPLYALLRRILDPLPR